MDEVYSRANLTAVAARKERKEMEAARFNAALLAWKTKWVTTVELAAAEGSFPNVTLVMTIEPTLEFLDSLSTPQYQVTSTPQYRVTSGKWDEPDLHGWKLSLKERPASIPLDVKIN